MLPHSSPATLDDVRDLDLEARRTATDVMRNLARV